MTGSGGLGAISAGLSEVIVWLIVTVVVVLGVWKLAKLIRAAFSG